MGAGTALTETAKAKGDSEAPPPASLLPPSTAAEAATPEKAPVSQKEATIPKSGNDETKKKVYPALTSPNPQCGVP